MLSFARELSKVHGWLTHAEAELLYNKASQVKADQAVVEIGSWHGKSTICLGRGAKSGFGAKVYAVDPHKGSEEHLRMYGQVDTLDIFTKNIQSFQVSDIVVPVVKKSEDASKELKLSVGLLFIDGAHDYKNVETDFLCWFPKVVNGGHIAFHDSWAWRFLAPGVVSAKYLLFSGKLCKPKLVDSITLVQKTDHVSTIQLIQNIVFVITRALIGGKVTFVYGWESYQRKVWNRI